MTLCITTAFRFEETAKETFSAGITNGIVQAQFNLTIILVHHGSKSFECLLTVIYLFPLTNLLVTDQKNIHSLQRRDSIGQIWGEVNSGIHDFTAPLLGLNDVGVSAFGIKCSFLVTQFLGYTLK